MASLDPSDLHALRRQVEAVLGPDAAETIRFRAIVIDDDALRLLAGHMNELAAADGNVMLVWDDRPMARGEDSLKPLIAQAAGSTGLPQRVVELPRDLHTDEASAQTVLDALDERSIVIGVGSGNLIDTCKHACWRFAEPGPGAGAGGTKPPLICWPTANSVNAFTSSLAVLVVNGVKRTMPSVPADVILCDLPTLASAPPAMQQAGLGDMIARCTAQGDWYLAHILGMDDAYSDGVYTLLGDIEHRVLQNARAIGERTAGGTRILTEALLLSGLVLSAAKQTAPLSGWEHVISHYLDLRGLAEGRQLALHGAQVGVGTLISACAYEMLIDEAQPHTLTPEQVYPVPESVRAQIDKHFAPFDPDGARREELWRDCQAKLSLWHDQRDRWEAFCADWQAGHVQAELRELVRPSAVVRDALAACGAPTMFADLEPSIDADWAAGALCHAHLVRARFTVGDLLSTCGLLPRIAERFGK